MGVNKELFEYESWSRVKAVSGDDHGDEVDLLSSIGSDIDYAIIRVHVVNNRSAGGFFGGASPDELDLLAFSDMANSKSWKITPSLADIKIIMKAVGADKTILSIDFRQPYVLDEGSDLLSAGAILATFGVSDAAVLDILTGKSKPTGKLPFALSNKPQAVVTQDSDAPGYPEKDILFPFGFGLTY